MARLWHDYGTIIIETPVGERDMVRALNLQAGGTDPTGYVMTNSRVYTTRVCFPNRGSR